MTLRRDILVPLLPRYKVAARPLVAVYPRAPEVPHKVKLFIDFLIQWITPRATWI